MDQLAVGVIGCGGHGRGHVQYYDQTPQARVVAVADVDGERAQKVAAEFAVAYHYADYAEMLRCHELDIVSLALPPPVNRNAVLAAFAAGAHVMVSKPLAANLAEAKEMVAAAQRSSKWMSMGLQNRCAPEVQLLRQVVAAGRLGRVYHTRLWHGHEMHIPTSPSLHRRQLAGGGVLFHTTVHLLDATLWALGNPKPVRAAAASYQKLGRMKSPPTSWEGDVAACDIEDFNIGLVHFADGSTMTIESNWLMHPRPRPSGAEILGDWGVGGLRPLKLELEEDGQVVDATPALPENPPNAFGQICLDFCQSIIENRVPLVRFAEMLDVQRIMDALYAAAAQGREIDITE